MKKGYVYLLLSLKDNKFYLGSTTDMKRRLDAHNKGLNPSTKHRYPFELVYYEVFDSYEIAKRREYKLKRNPNMFYYFKKDALLCASRSKDLKQVVG